MGFKGQWDGMALWVKRPATKPDDLSSNLRTPMVREERTDSCRLSLKHHTCAMPAYKHIHVINKIL